MIRHRIRMPFTQMAMAILLGVAGGVYIYKPCFEPLQPQTATTTTNQINAEVPKKPDQTD
ncbi:hypothetical protein NQD34_001915 [Periophthalmus magnuspinnatus]|nr:hypothetical protein NQD34_001915 [Periophthalmus magnuspinnatus]